ncbi:NlpC/P60 family protein [Psychrobacillus sp. FSL K6-2684]|uniref:C40 family peptidase n=1 Tax=unclassified Psychrobacillus TaxID=2636677 RepID=UPI00124442D3|nr:C40 family peptidase [Psychrobacillus sp. AK 1817]QEY20482.1 peptidoglycan endopeptidase [Psychrobacillus sp. AK 1817]
MRKKVLIIAFILFFITETASASTLYEVKKGDSLTKIAKLHNVTVADLRTWNKLTKDNIFIKQKLVVQKPATVKGTTNTTPVKTAPVVTAPVKNELVVSPAPVITVPSNVSGEGYAYYPLIIDFAKRLEGIPYLYAGNTMAGFDCSGFIYFLHTQAGMKIERKSSESYYLESIVLTNPIPGDLVFFQNTYKEGISHMGIYLGDNQFVHAGSKGVEITKLDNVYWKEHFVSFNRFVQK